MPISDSDAIHALLTDWARAIEARDLDGITGHYTDETVLFDAIPPYRTVGRAAIRQAWADCLPHFPETFTTDLRDVTVQAAGGLAWAHFLLHFTPADPALPSGQTWMRVTAAYQRRPGGWASLHEHVSIPFNPMDNTAWFITDPARADAPDYSAGPCAEPGP